MAQTYDPLDRYRQNQARKRQGVVVYPAAGQQLRPQQAPQVEAPPATKTNDIALNIIQKGRALQSPQATQQEEESGNAFGRGLGFLINNPVTRVISQPLDVLDVPRRAVWSTINEVADAVNGGDASFSDWYDQINPLRAIHGEGDTSFGAGDVIQDTGNKWLDRAVGLAGDIALDPLTYVAGIGFLGEAGTAPGRAGRALSAVKAADRARDGGKISQEMLDQIQRVTQRGYHEADDELLDLMGVKGGIRMGIPFTQRQTAPVLPGVSRATSKARVGLRDAAEKVGLRSSDRRLVAAGSPKEIEEGYRRLFRGEGPLNTETAIEQVATDLARRRGQGTLAGEFGREADQLVKESRKLSAEDRAAAIRALENKEAPSSPFAVKLRGLLDRLWDQANEAGLPLERQESYAPHILTRDAIQWLRSSGDDASAVKLRGFVMEDLFAPSGVTMHRKFRPGETIELNGRVIKLDNASIEELNAAFKKATGKEFSFYETDPGDIIEKYINMLSSDVGTAFAARERAAAGANLIRNNPKFTPTDAAGRPTGAAPQPVVGVTPVDGGDFENVNNVTDEVFRGGFRLSEPLAEGAEGPVMYGRSDLEAVGERIGTELDPELFRARLSPEAGTQANNEIVIGLKKQRDRLEGESTKLWDEVIASIENMPAQPAERFALWSKMSKRLTGAKKRTMAESDRALRELDALGADRAAIVQQIDNLEAGVKLHEDVIDAIFRDLEVMDEAARRAGNRQLRQTVETLNAERDELRAQLQRIKERQDALPRPWADDADLLARQADLADPTALPKANMESLEEWHWEQLGGPIQEQELARLQAARASQTAPLRELADDAPASAKRTVKSIDGRIAATKKRIEELRASQQRALAADDMYQQARKEAAQYRSPRPSAEGQQRALDQTLDPNAARTPNLVPPGAIPGNVRGVPLSEVGDFSSDRVRDAMGMARNTVAETPEQYQVRRLLGGEAPDAGISGAAVRADRVPASASKEVAEATRKGIENIVDPGEAVRVPRAINQNREAAKTLIRKDAAAVESATGRINEINEALTSIIGSDPTARDNLRELFIARFTGNEQGEARRVANEALEQLFGDEMGARISSAVDEIADLTNSQWRSDEWRGLVKKYSLEEVDGLIQAQRQAVLDAVQKRGEAIARSDQARAGVETSAEALRKANRVKTQAEVMLEGMETSAMRAEAGGIYDDLVAVADNAPDDLAASTAALLGAAIDTAKQLDGADLSLKNVNEMISAGQKGELARAINIELADQWSIMEPHLLGNDILIHDDLRQAFQRVREAQFDRDFWPVVDGFTNFFKTYATLSPGFHLRNAMSAVFMNASDGVSVASQREGITMMNSFLRASKEGKQIAWLEKNGARVLNEGTGLTVRDAFSAAFGSGIGGRYRERGFADRLTARGKLQEKAFSNRLVDLSKRAGGWVEGGVRLPVAIDTLKRGGDLNDAMTRINRLHFDYSQTSKFDEKARKLIPFWTFMSRNLPMQITQMWTKPRAYAWYNSFVRNFKGDAEPGTPEYFDAVGAFRFGDTTMGGLPLFLQPDLPHLRIQEDLQRYQNALEGNPGQFLTDFNPLFTAPVEFATNQDFFTGRQYDETDLRKTGGLETPIGWLSQALGLGETTPGGDFATQERFISLARSMLPMYDRAVRLAPGATTANNATDANSRQLESYLRFIGVPVRQLSPEQQEATQRSEFFSNRDAQRMQRTLYELDQTG